MTGVVREFERKEVCWRPPELYSEDSVTAVARTRKRLVPEGSAR